MTAWGACCLLSCLSDRSHWLRPRSIPSPLPTVLPIGHLPSSGSCNLILSSPSLFRPWKWRQLMIFQKIRIQASTRLHGVITQNTTIRTIKIAKQKPLSQLIALLYSTAPFRCSVKHVLVTEIHYFIASSLNTSLYTSCMRVPLTAIKHIKHKCDSTTV